MLIKKIIFVFFLFFGGLARLFSQVDDKTPHISIDGIFHSKNIYVQNPFGPNGVGFCVTKVFINGIEDTLDETGSSAFEIIPSRFSILDGDSLWITIYHHEDCQPKILNPEVIFIHSDIFKSIYIDSAYILHFTTASTFGSEHSYYVQQFRWDKWVVIGNKIPALSSGTREYSMDIKPYLVNGENEFRVRLPIPCGYFESKSASCLADAPVIIYDSQAKCNTISFSKETLWELFDSTMVQKGFGDAIDYSFYSKAKSLTLNYDNQTVIIKPNSCRPSVSNDSKNENNISPVILIYPNPTQTEFNVSTGMEFNGYALTVQILDLTGRIISSTFVQGGTSSPINVENLSDGIYFVRVLHNNEIVGNQKLTIHQ
jgi:hypothetical protein